MISILQVDGEPAFLELTRAFLEMQGDILVDGAPSALEAIEMLKRHTYDAIVSAYQMPGMDGLRFLSYVRSHYGEVPFILLTGRGREEVAIQALNGGADFYLQKEGGAKEQFADLARKVRMAVERRRRVEDRLSESEASYRALAENVPGPVYRVHLREGRRIQFFNDMIVPLIGYSPEAGWTWTQFMEEHVDPRDRSAVSAAMKEALDLDRPFEIEYRLLRKGGGTVRVLQRGRPIRGSGGLPRYIDGVILETNHAQGIWPDHGRERGMLDLADVLPALVFETDVEGRITYVDGEAQVIERLEREGLMEGLSLFDLVRPEERCRTAERMERILNGDPCEGEVFEFVRRDGTCFPANIHCGAVWENGEVVGTQGLFVDVSALFESKRVHDAVHAISQAAISDMTLEELYRKIHRTLGDLIPLGNFYIADFDEESGEISFPYFVDSKDPNPGRRRKAKGVTEYVLGVGEPLLIGSKEIGTLKAAGEIEVLGTPPAQILAVPLVMEGEIIGLMAAQSYDPQVGFTLEHKEAMCIASGPVALAIQRKKQEMELQRYVGLLRITFDSTNDGVLILDAEGKALAWNERFVRMWGFPETVLRTKEDQRFLDFILEKLEEPEAFAAKVKELCADASLTDFDMLRLKDGRYFERYSQPFLLEDEVAGRIWSYRDVTARTVTEEALNKSERELKYIINSAKDAIFVKDPEGTYSMANEAMATLFHVQPGDMLGRRDADFFDPAAAQANARSDQQVLQGITVEEEVVWNVEGSAHTFSLVKVPLRNSSGKVFGICGIARDTTERRKVEKALKDANESLNLLSSITRHDVLNQLMVIRGYSDLVRTALKDPKLLDYMDKVERATRNIRQQILFTRDFQKLGVAEPKWQLVEEILDKSLTSLEVDRLDISVDLGGLELLADPMLEKVFYNYLDNTLRHGEKVSHVTVSCNRQGDDLLLVYQDDGQGVKPEEKQRIFDRGFGKNTGLGLFLVRLILNVTGIQVREVGEYGKGVRFEMIVPDGAYRFGEWDDAGDQ
jgi:PAS domain S-box-containing protein